MMLCVLSVPTSAAEEAPDKAVSATTTEEGGAPKTDAEATKDEEEEAEGPFPTADATAEEATSYTINTLIMFIAAVLVLSGGLYKTGVANIVGAQVMRLAGQSPFRVTALMMLTAGRLMM